MLNAVLATATALTTTQAAGETTRIDGSLQQVVYIMWTPGTSGNVLTVSPQTRCVINGTGGAWAPDMEWSASPGTKTKTDNTYTFTASGVSEVTLRIMVPLGGDELRVLASESEAGGATKGTYSCKVFSVNE